MARQKTEAPAETVPQNAAVIIGVEGSQVAVRKVRVNEHKLFSRRVLARGIQNEAL